MIPARAILHIAWVDPAILLMDHRAHGTPLDRAHLLALTDRLLAEPEQSTDPIVAQLRDGRLWVENGRHRVLAHLLAGRATIAVVIVGE